MNKSANLSDGDYVASSVDEMIHDMVKDSPDMVNHPPHYKSGGMEVIDIIDAFTEDSNSYYVGNIIKYALRYRNKNGLEDLKKAQWYLNRLIEKEEKK